MTKVLVIELAEKCYTPLDPVFLWLICGNFDSYDKVCGMAGGGEHAPAITGLIEGGVVGGLLWDLIFLARLEPNLHRQKRKGRMVTSTRTKLEYVNTERDSSSVAAWLLEVTFT